MAFADSSVFGELGDKAKANPIVLNSEKGFKAVTWTGSNNSVSLDFGNFTPDLLWIKNRYDSGGSGISHALIDTVRGGDNRLASDTDGAQSTNAGLSTFNSDNTVTLMGGLSPVNDGGNDRTYVAWSWKAGGAPEAGFQTDDSMVDGEATTCSALTAKAGATITPTSMSVGTETGFSIVKYTGNGYDFEDSPSGASVPHGFTNKTPDMIIVKSLTTTSGWSVLPAFYSSDGGQVLGLNTGTELSSAGSAWAFNKQLPDNNVFYVGQNDGGSHTNNSDSAYIAYCWHSVPGFSAFGSFDSTSAGIFVYLGFKPALIIAKDTTSIGHWSAYDNARQPFNTGSSNVLYPDLPNPAGSNSTVYNFEFLSNGFRSFGTGSSFNSGTHIYMAFAEQPFELANAR